MVLSIGGPATDACRICCAVNDLHLCNVCKVDHYCGKDHEIGDSADREAKCNKVRDTREALHLREQELRDPPKDSVIASNVFENGVGHFWKIVETRDYMQARYAYIMALRRMDSRISVRIALDHVIDMLRLCRRDTISVGIMAPAFYLRLGYDQQAYDFMKGYFTRGDDPEQSQPYEEEPDLSIQGADAFEDPDVWMHQSFDLIHKSAVMLIKLRLLRDLRNLQHWTDSRPQSKIPQEICDEISKYLVGNVVSSRIDIISQGDQSKRITQIQTQVDQLYRSVNDYNKYFWPALVEPKVDLETRAPSHRSGDQGEVQLELRYTYAAWFETPGAIQFIRQKIESAKSVDSGLGV
ncbi:MAG: hypothetical protein M1828_005813 [Chrysothrix sp. TS-e1954]|nr:MAG: hypothetical protein M1828_005813 [Chrysothrix sp. TS-e1954]